MEKIFDVTSHASHLVYRLEMLSKVKTPKRMIRDFVELEKMRKSFPSELEFVDCFYDTKTGSSGTLFKNINEDNYILSYTGTNFYFDRAKDMYADIVGICLGQGEHYTPCYKFYKRMQKKYGDNIILTGHSLGGNIAMRVALEYNVAETVVYNAAPLYLVDGVELFMEKNADEQLYTERLARYKKVTKKIEKRKEAFTGNVKRIVSESDLFTRIAELLEIGSYIGEEYILKDAGLHGVKSFLGVHQQTLTSIFSEQQEHENITDAYKDFSLEELKLLRSLSKDTLITLEEQLNTALQNERVLASLNKNPYGVNFNKFLMLLIEKIEKQKTKWQ